MTTKKKNTPSDRKSKTESFQEAQEEGQRAANMWDRLDDLGFAFQHAAVRYRREDLAKVGVILHELAQDPDFREAAYSSVRTHVSRKHGHRMLTRRDEEDFLLGTVSSFMAGHTVYAELAEEGLLTDRPPPFAEAVARLILHSLPQCPGLYSRAKGPPPGLSLVDPRVEDKDLQETVERVTRAIAPKLVDPDAPKPKLVIRAAMRTLGVDAGYVKNMFLG